MNPEKQLQKILNQIVESSRTQIYNIRADPDDTQQFIALMYYCRILEMTRSITMLLNPFGIPAFPIVARTIFEAFYLFKMIIDDSDFLKSLYYDHENSRLQMIRYAKENPEGSIVGKLGQSYNIDEKLSEVSSTRNELKDYKSHLKLVAEKLGTLDEYHSVYKLLSWHAHSGIGIVEKNHLAEIEGDPNLVVTKPSLLENIRPEISLVSMVLTNCPSELEKLGEARISGFNRKNIDRGCEKLLRFQMKVFSYPK